MSKNTLFFAIAMSVTCVSMVLAGCNSCNSCDKGRCGRGKCNAPVVQIID